MGVYIKGVLLDDFKPFCPCLNGEYGCCDIPGIKHCYGIGRDNCPLAPVPPHMSAAIEKVISERERQMELWGECSDNHPFEWMSILGEEFGELCEAVNETYFKNGAHPEYGGNEKIIKEAVHVAAVAVAIIESAIRAGEG